MPAERMRYRPSDRCLTRCHSDDDGHCVWPGCPQLRDGEPKATGRHCPIDKESIHADDELEVRDAR